MLLIGTMVHQTLTPGVLYQAQCKHMSLHHFPLLMPYTSLSYSLLVVRLLLSFDKMRILAFCAVPISNFEKLSLLGHR